MKEYLIEITETLQRRVKVLAESENAALSLLKMKYQKEEIILDENNYIMTEYDVLNK